MIFEVRLYSVVPGRLDVALERFQHHLPALFADHGIDNIGRWVATAGPDVPMFVYMMAYISLAEREAQWAGFYADPRWPQVRSATQGDEEATESFELFFMSRNAAWAPPPAGPGERLGGVFDLAISRAALGKTAATNHFLTEAYLPAVARAGARVVLVADLLTGAQLPKVAILMCWDSAEARRAGWVAIQSDVALNQAIAAARKTHGRPLLGQTDTYTLEPTAFALPSARMGYRAG